MALVRAVMILALYELLEDAQLGSMLYLVLIDTFSANPEPIEQPLRDAFLSRAQEAYLTTAQATWDGPPEQAALTKSKKAAPSKTVTVPATLKVQYSLAKPDELAKGVEAAVKNGQAITNYGVNEQWLMLFAPQLASAITEAINAVANSVVQSVNTGLGKAMATLEEKVAGAQATAQQMNAQGRQMAILWWLQVKYSAERALPYRELEVADGAAQMALDFQDLVPAPAPPHVEAVIPEAVRSAYSGADIPGPLLETLRGLTDLRPTQASASSRTLWAWVGRDAVAADFEQATGVKADTPITPVALSRWLFRQAQAERMT